MVHTAILGRKYGRPIINLGFSGNGKMEPEVTELLAELDLIARHLPDVQAIVTAAQHETETSKWKGGLQQIS